MIWDLVMLAIAFVGGVIFWELLRDDILEDFVDFGKWVASFFESKK